MYSLTLDLGGLPSWCRVTVTSALSEFEVSVMRFGSTYAVIGDEATVRTASAAALQRIGKRIEDVVIDLFA